MTSSNVEQILHYIKVKLYKNYLPKVKGKYIARTDNNKTLSMEDVCASLKTRAGFTGKPDDLLGYVRQYYEEVAFLLSDGFAVNNGYYCIYPNIGGTFDSIHETHDHRKNPVSIRFSVRAKLRNLIKNIEVIIDGMADTSGYIAEYTDTDESSVNAFFVPKDQFIIRGHKIKIEGDSPDIGVYFVPVDDPAKAVKVSRIAKNSSTEIIGIAPDTEYQYNRIEIRTQYSGSSNKILKSTRTITSEFILEEV